MSIFCRMKLVHELSWAGLLAEAGSEHAREEGFAAWMRGLARGGGVEAVEDEEIALGVVEGRESGDALQVVRGGEGVHLVVFDLIPGDVPAGAIGLDADGEVHGAEVVADGG
jgi:hypothetical protein